MIWTKFGVVKDIQVKFDKNKCVCKSELMYSYITYHQFECGNVILYSQNIHEFIVTYPVNNLNLLDIFCAGVPLL